MDRPADRARRAKLLRKDTLTIFVSADVVGIIIMEDSREAEKTTMAPEAA